MALPRSANRLISAGLRVRMSKYPYMDICDESQVSRRKLGCSGSSWAHAIIRLLFQAFKNVSFMVTNRILGYLVNLRGGLGRSKP